MPTPKLPTKSVKPAIAAAKRRAAKSPDKVLTADVLRLRIDQLKAQETKHRQDAERAESQRRTLLLTNDMAPPGRLAKLKTDALNARDKLADVAVILHDTPSTFRRAYPRSTQSISPLRRPRALWGIFSTCRDYRWN